MGAECAACTPCEPYVSCIGKDFMTLAADKAMTLAADKADCSAMPEWCPQCEPCKVCVGSTDPACDECAACSPCEPYVSCIGEDSMVPVADKADCSSMPAWCPQCEP